MIRSDKEVNGPVTQGKGNEQTGGGTELTDQDGKGVGQIGTEEEKIRSDVEWQGNEPNCFESKLKREEEGTYDKKTARNVQ